MDQITAEVLSTFGRYDVPCILLKGPSIGLWLYGPDELRTYGDVDLLVVPSGLSTAEDSLASLGFRRGQAGWLEMSRSWTREAGENVDLHTAFFGIEVDANIAWSVLEAHTEEMAVGGVSATILDAPALLVHVATHAAQHGGDHPKPHEDLRRAVRLPRAPWREAVRLARELNAVDTMAAGMRMLPEGARLADELGLPDTWAPHVAMHAEPARPLVRGFEQLSRMPPARRAGFAAGKLFPRPDYLRQVSATARHGRVGLVLAYAWRPFWLLGQLVPGVTAWARARRSRRVEHQ